MKTFAATFHFPHGTTAVATARFATLPGESAIVWTGDTQTLTASLIPEFGLVDYGYAATFETAMQTMAENAGARIEIQHTGDWEIYEE